MPTLDEDIQRKRIECVRKYVASAHLRLIVPTGICCVLKLFVKRKRGCWCSDVMKRQWHRIDIGHIQWHRQRFSNVCVCLTAIFSLYMANIFSIYYDSDSVFNWEKHKPRSLTPLIIPEYFCLSINETFSFFVVMNTPVEYHFNYPLKLWEMTTGDVAEYQPFIGSDEVPCGIANVRASYCGITEFRYSYVRKTHTHYTEYDTWCPIE